MPDEKQDSGCLVLDILTPSLRIAFLAEVCLQSLTTANKTGTSKTGSLLASFSRLDSQSKFGTSIDFGIVGLRRYTVSESTNNTTNMKVFFTILLPDMRSQYKRMPYGEKFTKLVGGLIGRFLYL